MYLLRAAPIEADLKRGSVLLLGPRRTGKSAFIRHEVQADAVYDLLRSDVFQRLSQRPAIIREALRPGDRLVVIDEIQKLPGLMDEVHLMVEEHGVRFLLTGSSARKLRRTHTSLMAGRARIRRLCPFVSAEVEALDLDRALAFGMLPPVYLSDEPAEELRGYAGLYLKEEIQAEAISRNIEGFSRFLGRAAQSSGEVLNFESVADDSQVPARTVREYFHVLEDTLVGAMIEPLASGGRRKTISKGKFFFFDVGVMRALREPRGLDAPLPASLLGPALEHFVFQELFAYIQYFARDTPLNFWRTYSQQEVDFVVGGDIAIEVKASATIHDRHVKGLHALAKERPLRRRLVVCREPRWRRHGDVEVYPVMHFLNALWSHEFRLNGQ